MSKIAKLEFIAELRGQVNGQPIEVDGEGSIVQAIGVTAGTYFIKRLPEDFDPKLLAGCLVTGYPSACAHNSETINPFGLSNYSYERRLFIADRCDLRLYVNCEYEISGKLISRFTLNGTVDLPSLGDVGPIVETWSRLNDSQIAAAFDMNWATSEERVADVTARSTYTIETPLAIPDRVVRSIDVTPRMMGERIFTLFQVSSIQ